MFPLFQNFNDRAEEGEDMDRFGPILFRPRKAHGNSLLWNVNKSPSFQLSCVDCMQAVYSSSPLALAKDASS